MLVCRVADIGIGICPAHTTPQPYVTVFCTGAPTVLTEGRPTVRRGDIGVATCGHPTVALTSSNTVFAQGSQVHRQFDIGANAGPYVAVTSSGTFLNTL